MTGARAGTVSRHLVGTAVSAVALAGLTVRLAAEAPLGPLGDGRARCRPTAHSPADVAGGVPRGSVVDLAVAWRADARPNTSGEDA